VSLPELEYFRTGTKKALVNSLMLCLRDDELLLWSVHIYTLEPQSGDRGIRVLHGQALGATLRGHALPLQGLSRCPPLAGETDTGRDRDQRVGPKMEEKGDAAEGARASRVVGARERRDPGPVIRGLAARPARQLPS
jgi:hypothetical protein